MDTFGASTLRQRGSYERTLTTPSPMNNNAGINRTYPDNNYRTPQPHDWSEKISKLTKVLGEEIHTASNAASQLFHSPSLFHTTHNPVVNPNQGGINYTNAITKILQSDDPYHIKCDDLSKTCLSCSARELIDVFPLLVHNIFGFSNTRGWGLHTYTPRFHPYEYNPIYNFMLPNGCLFKIISKLLQEQEAVFHFPYESLPPGITECIDRGEIPLWYSQKLVLIADKQIVAKFNALEYFFACFAHFVRHPNTMNQAAPQWSGIEDVLYVRLFEDYLRHIFPVDEQHVTNTQSPTVSHTTFHSPITSTTQTSRKSDIWKSSSQVVTHLNTPNYNSHMLHTPSKAECFLQILCDFWLSLNTEEFIIKKQECKLPSADHARMVRILVKYLHLFVNQQDQTLQTFVADNSARLQLQELKNVVIPALLYEKLYFYLQRCFKHWQLDSSFRMVLETWLSFIQPWRYVKKDLSLSEDNIEVEISSWQKFIENNMVFYTSFLQMFLTRALRYDFKSMRDMQLVYRVAKVFSQPSLCKLLHEESDSTSPGSSIGSTLGYSPATTRRAHFEVSSGNVLSVFAKDTVRQARELCHILSTTIIGVRHRIVSSTDDTKKRRSGFVARVKDFLMIEDDDDVMAKQREDERLIEYLQQTLYMLNTLFKFPPVDTLTSSNGATGSYDSTDSGLRLHPSTAIGQSNMPDCVITENGVELTTRGRFQEKGTSQDVDVKNQIIQGLRQFNIIYSGDPEFQPIRSFESATAVRFWYRIASIFNEKYSTQLEDVYNGRDFMGKTLRRISRQLHHDHFLNNPISLPNPPSRTQANNRLKPRVSLRFAGSYYFMGYFCWVMILSRLFGFSWLAILFLMFVVSIGCLLYHVDTPPIKTRDE